METLYTHPGVGCTVFEGPNAVTVSDAYCSGAVASEPHYVLSEEPVIIRHPLGSVPYVEAREDPRAHRQLSPYPAQPIYVQGQEPIYVSEPSVCYGAGPRMRVPAYEEQYVVVQEPSLRYVSEPPLYEEPLRVQAQGLRYITEPPTYEDPAVYVTVQDSPGLDNSDWVVAEKVPRTIVRHKVIDIGPDGRYIIGDPSAGGAGGDPDVYVTDYGEGIVKLPDGRVKLADGVIQSAPAAKKELQGSIVALSDGSVLYPDGTIEYPDGTVRKPANMTYSATELSNKFLAGDSHLSQLNEEIAELRELLKKEEEKVKELERAVISDVSPERASLREQLGELLAEKGKYEQELHQIRDSWPGVEVTLQKIRDEIYNSPHEVHLRESLISKDEYVRQLNDQLIAEARSGAEARGILSAIQEERAHEAETRNLLISEAVLRKESEMAHENKVAIAELKAKAQADREALLHEERANAERVVEAELAAERERLQGQLQELQELAEAEKKRADEEQLMAAVERERALAVEEQLAALRLATPKKKKKSKRKGRKGRKGKGKAKPKGRPMGVMIGGPRKPMASKAPARRQP